VLYVREGVVNDKRARQQDLPSNPTFRFLLMSGSASSKLRPCLSLCLLLLGLLLLLSLFKNGIVVS
jgi:hypothetical protein